MCYYCGIRGFSKYRQATFASILRAVPERHRSSLPLLMFMTIILVCLVAQSRTVSVGVNGLRAKEMESPFNLRSWQATGFMASSLKGLKLSFLYRSSLAFHFFPCRFGYLALALLNRGRCLRSQLRFPQGFHTVLGVSLSFLYILFYSHPFLSSLSVYSKSWVRWVVSGSYGCGGDGYNASNAYAR